MTTTRKAQPAPSRAATRLLAAVLAAAGLAFAAAARVAHGAPIVPSGDDEVVEVLPAAAANREDRLLRKRLAQRPDDAALAVVVARRYFAQAREAGDPRLAGLAAAAIARWPDARTAPADVLLVRADLQQYVHDFDAAAATLRALLDRPGQGRTAQAWLTLATLRRVQGRYADSDAACREVERSGAALHGSACLAENAALRGDVAGARRTFERLLADPRLPAPTRQWLLTSLAELEERDGRHPAADAAYRDALRVGPDAYAAVAYADFLIERRRPQEALAALRGQVRTDAVLVRLSIAGTLARAPGHERDVAETRERFALENERPDARVLHGREQAMFALHVDRAAERAFELARGDVALQREPLDLLVFAQAARATGRSAAIDDARRLKQSLGLHDRRIDAAL